MGLDGSDIVKRFVNFTLNILNLTIEISYLFLGKFLLICGIVCILDLLLGGLIILIDEINELAMILLKLRLWVEQSILLSASLLLEPLNFLLDSIVGELNEEHLFLLIDELSDVLRSLLPWKLNPRFGDVHCWTDIASLVGVEIVDIFVALNRADVRIFHSS